MFIFDEATSALDTQSEKIVQDALNRSAKGKTTVNIAHRVSTIKDCDVIFVLNEKKVAEQGKFDELMRKKGVFWNINKEK